MKIRAPLLLVALLPIAAYSQNDGSPGVAFVCADTAVEMQIHDSDVTDVSQRKYPVESIIALTITRGGDRSNLTFRAGGDRAGGACTTDSQGRSRIVFVAQCAPASCGIEPAWGILDPVSGRMLLVPEDGNSERAVQVLGSELPDVQQTMSLARASPE